MKRNYSDQYIARENFYYIVRRVVREFQYSWRAAFEFTSAKDWEVNQRRLFNSYATFKQFKHGLILANRKMPYPKHSDCGRERAIMHGV